jgi:hypothetical protein
MGRKRDSLSRLLPLVSHGDDDDDSRCFMREAGNSDMHQENAYGLTSMYLYETMYDARGYYFKSQLLIGMTPSRWDNRGMLIHGPAVLPPSHAG